MATYDAWKQFLKHFRYDKTVGVSNPITHTSIDHPKGAFHVPTDKYDEFMTMYLKAMVNGVPLYMTEKPLDVSPVRVDLDFRFLVPSSAGGSSVSHNHATGKKSLPSKKAKTDASTFKSDCGASVVSAATTSVADGDAPEKPPELPRLYTKEHVKQFVRAYFKILHNYVNAPPEAFKAFVMEKPTPSEYNKKIKDGLHIVFPHLLCNKSFQHLVRHQILAQAGEVFQGVPVCNTYEDVVDKAVISNNNWQMYGSTKPGCLTYKVTQVYTWEEVGDHWDVKEHFTNPESKEMLSVQEMMELPRLLSMRPADDASALTPVHESKQAEVDEYIRCVLPTMDDRRKTKLHGQVFGLSNNNTKTRAPEEELDLAKQLVLRCLKHDRVDNYEDWIKLGWCLRNIDIGLLDTWIEFSKVSSKYIEGECQNLWNKMQNETLGMGTLRWWARQDNPHEYGIIINSKVLTLIDKCIVTSGAHFDVARVVHAMFKDRYRHTVKETWYVYEDEKHRWIHTRDALRLRTALSLQVCSEFMKRGIYWQDQSMADPENRDLFFAKVKTLNKIAEKLRDSGYKGRVMKECECMFTDEKFEQLLDSHPHLIGFENGVYDMRLHEFRDGMPDDYISFNTKQHYFPFNKNCVEAQELDAFFKQVYTKDSVRKYVMDILSSVIDGSIKMEKFFVFTGQGSNGKSKLLELCQKAIGDYYCIVPISFITQKRAASNQAAPELERTKGRRMAVLQEPGENEKLNVGLLKEVTGGDIIQCRGLFKEPIEFKPQFKMFLICNDLPEVPSDDGGTWRRLNVTEHTSRFCEEPSSDPAKREFPMDMELSEKLVRWAPVFISMLIDYHMNTDPKKVVVPHEVKFATDKYKKNNDIIGQYVEEMIRVTPQDLSVRLSITKIWSSFKSWTASVVSKGRKVPDRNQLKTYLENLLGKYPPGSKGWKGVSFTDDEESEDED
jgi:P4 family phage/plasmid primase-like protien